MANDAKLLRKMYLLSDVSVKKLKEIEAIERQFSSLDNQMKKVLYNKALNNYTKWHMYNNLLQQYNHLRQQLKDQHSATKKQENTSIQTQTNSDVNENKPNPFEANERTNIPDIADLDFASDFENRNNSEFFNNLENNYYSNGVQESLTPEQKNRLSVFSTASVLKKSAPVLRHHLVPEMTFTNNDSYDLSNPNQTILEEDEILPSPPATLEPETPPKKKKTLKPKISQNIEIKGNVYSLHVDDVDDFREFAADEFKRYPMQTVLTDQRFRQWQKRKENEFRRRLSAEAKALKIQKAKEATKSSKKMTEYYKQTKPLSKTATSTRVVSSQSQKGKGLAIKWFRMK